MSQVYKAKFINIFASPFSLFQILDLYRWFPWPIVLWLYCLIFYFLVISVPCAIGHLIISAGIFFIFLFCCHTPKGAGPPRYFPVGFFFFLVLNNNLYTKQYKMKQFLKEWLGARKSTLSVKVLVLVAQSCPTLCNPMDWNPPGSSVHGVSQTRICSGLPFPSLHSV